MATRPTSPPEITPDAPDETPASPVPAGVPDNTPDEITPPSPDRAEPGRGPQETPPPGV